MSAPLELAPLLKGRKLNEHPGAHSDNYGSYFGVKRFSLLFIQNTIKPLKATIRTTILRSHIYETGYITGKSRPNFFQ